jgi:ADP-ribosyl-[dinitrogen reductase] hydrolase
MNRNRLLGALLGLASGDALGTTLEFKAPGTFEPMIDLVGGGPFRLNPGEWTDDTSMALCLAASLAECKGFDAKDQMDRYCRWSDQGYMSSKGWCFDIGNTVRTALRKYERTGDPFSGSSDPYSAGNGSLMRLAPVAIFYSRDAEAAVHYAAESSRTTHGATAAVDACRYFCGLLVRAFQGADKGDLLSSIDDQTPALCAPIAEIAAGSFKRKNPPEIVGSGYVVKSLEAALWAFYHGTDFREGALLAVNLGNDADTTGAIYGQIAGAYYGTSGIPEGWIKRLAKRDEIIALAEALLAVTDSPS